MCELIILRPSLRLSTVAATDLLDGPPPDRVRPWSHACLTKVWVALSFDSGQIEQ
jgi:hypothetical protein